MNLNIRKILLFCIVSFLFGAANAQNNDTPTDSIVILEKGKLVDGETIDNIKSQKNSININSPIVTKAPLFEICKTLKADADQKNCFNENMQKLVARNFNTSALLALPSGRHRIYCFFTISKEGDITNIDTYSEYKVAEDEALRVLSQLPKLEPGELNGKIGAINHWLPITFMLE